MKKVLILGGTTFDQIVHLPFLPAPTPKTIHHCHFFEGIGSTGAGKALNLTRLGVPNTLYTALGEDCYGEKIIRYLGDQAVNMIYDFDPAGTERHINIMDEQGGRVSIFITQSSEVINFNEDKIGNLINDSDIIVINIVSYCKQLISLLKKYNKPVWTDLHDYDGSNPYHQEFIKCAEFVHLSSDNLVDYKSLMVQLIAEGKELVICTHGRNGADALTKKGEWYHQPALKNFQMVDTNGAGDGFFSGFLCGYLQNKSTETCLQYGTIVAAYCITSQKLAYENLTHDFLISEHKRLFEDTK